MKPKFLISTAPKKTWFFLLKIILSVVAIWLAIKMVNGFNFKNLLADTDIVLFILSIFLYLLSQLVSSERLRLFVNLMSSGHKVSTRWNAKLYLTGMAYNLFLPGGIGGDAYKVIIYGRKFDTSKRRVAGGLIIDRLCGLIAIGLCLSVIPYFQEYPFFNWFGFFWILPVVLAFFILSRFIGKNFRRFERVYPLAVLYSVVVQVLQIASFNVLAHSIGVVDHDVSFAAVFLISSLATVIPVFLGGIGAREVVFASLATSMVYMADQGVSVALLFSAVTFISSIPGLFFGFDKNKRTRTSASPETV